MNSGKQFPGAVLVMEAAVATCWRFFSEATMAKIPDPEEPLGFSRPWAPEHGSWQLLARLDALLFRYRLVAGIPNHSGKLKPAAVRDPF